MNPLGGGFIPKNPADFDFIREDESDTVAEAAIRFNASHEEITTVLVGMDSMEHVIKNAEIGNSIRQFSKSKLKQIEEKLSKSLNELCTGCRYCEECPRGLQISKLMQAYNNKILSGVKDALRALKFHWHVPAKEAADCIKCGICEQKCTQHLPIMERMSEIATWRSED
jgi:hypothetical protein